MGNETTIRPLTVGRLARRVGVTPEALRYYERLGLIRPARRSETNYRLYGSEAVRRLHFIRRAEALGFSLNEIRELLSLHQRAGADAAKAKTIAEARIHEIENRIRNLERMRDGLAALATQCAGEGPAAECPILRALSTPEIT
ncbi:MAG: heavy metal-responsive transcriptional regulator [Gammaproteobacteria bacterium]